MKKVVILATLIFISFGSIKAQINDRKAGWNFCVEAATSAVPSFITSSHNQHLSAFVNFGRTLWPWFYLGIGSGYNFVSDGADCLPIYLNPRFYFLRNSSSPFIDSRIGAVAFSPEKHIGEYTYQAKTGLLGGYIPRAGKDKGLPLLAYNEISAGYMMQDHYSLAVYFNTYGATRLPDPFGYGGGYHEIAAGFRFGYQF